MCWTVKKQEPKQMAIHIHFLHITKSEIDLPSGTDIHSQQVYDKANENLLQFINKEGTLFREENPAIIFTSLSWMAEARLVLVFLLKDYNENIIKTWIHQAWKGKRPYRSYADHSKQTGMCSLASATVWK